MGTQTSRPFFAPSGTSRFSDAFGAAEGRLARLVPRIERFCRERPWTAIGLGLVLGLGLRSLLSRR